MSLYCDAVTRNYRGTGIMVFVRVLWDIMFKMYWKICHSFFKNALESSNSFNPNEITRRKVACSVCLKPVPMATRRLHTLWRFTYQRIYLMLVISDHSHVNGWWRCVLYITLCKWCLWNYHNTHVVHSCVRYNHERIRRHTPRCQDRYI